MNHIPTPPVSDHWFTKAITALLMVMIGLAIVALFVADIAFVVYGIHLWLS